MSPILLQGNLPNDFYENWVCIVVPKGIRCLVITKDGETTSRKINGSLIDTFQSRLPNGGTVRHNNIRDQIIIDCIFYDGTYFILDVLEWCGQQFAEGEFDFRMYWLNSKYEEEYTNTNNNEDSSMITEDNSINRAKPTTKNNFILLEKFGQGSILNLGTNALFPWKSYSPENSKVYIYHKEGHYRNYESDGETSPHFLLISLITLLKTLGQTV